MDCRGRDPVRSRPVSVLMDAGEQGWTMGRGSGIFF